MEHIILSDHYNTRKYYNKSKNCPGCDYAFVQSRDHIFTNCLGTRELQEYITRKYNVNITQEQIFFGKAEADEYNIILGYLVTVIKMNNRYIGKWGKAEKKEKIDYFEKTLGKMRK